MRLFEAGAPWQRALADVQVFELSGRFLYAASESDLSTVIGFLRSHNIALAAALPMVPTTTDCGYGVEGMVRPDGPSAAARRVRRLGGRLDYVVMDEPLTFGHEYRGRRACRYTIAETATGAAAMAATVAAVFPDVKLCDVEAVDHFQGEDWLLRFENWLDEFQKAAGRAFSCFQADPWWDGPWRDRTPLVMRSVGKRSIEYGVLFTAGANPTSDREWIERAQGHINEFRSVISAKPGQAVFTSWQKYPSRVLPDTEPTTLTYLIAWYASKFR
jgi:hypothetical protein